MAFPGPSRLGRGAVVNRGDADPLGAEERFLVDGDLLSSDTRMAEVVDRMHRAWQDRRPMLVELDVEPDELRQPTVEERPLWTLGADYSLLRERLHFLTWANNWDCRDGTPVWWWGTKATALGAVPGGEADIVTASGASRWVDGGPRGLLDQDVVSAESVEAGPRRASGHQVYEPDLPLDPAQRAAMEHAGGPARIIATAGSGKTRTLLARIRYLVDQVGVEPRLITAVAYNRRAADEMRERLGRADLHIRTIHSLGWAIIREALGDPILMEEPDVRRELARLVPTRGTLNKDLIGSFIEGLSDARLALADPDEVGAERSDLLGFSQVFRRYRYRAAQRDLVDHDEQVYRAAELLLADPDLRARWQGRCRHLLVDEFQDLTPAYLLLLRILASPRLNVFGVGDDDQTIYGYAGADPKFLVDFDGFFPGAADYALDTNYRSPARVVRAGGRLVGHNRVRVAKNLTPAPGAVDTPAGLRVRQLPDAEITSETVRQVQSWLDAGVAPKEIAVLARVNSTLLPVLVGLSHAGIPVRSRLHPGLMERSVMRSALAWIRIALDPVSMRRSDLLEAVRRPSRGLNQVSRRILVSRRYSSPQLTKLADGLTERQAEAWVGWQGDLAVAARRAETGQPGPLLDWMINTLGLSRSAHLLDRNRSRAGKPAHRDDLVALRRSAYLLHHLPTFEQELRATMSAGRGSVGGVSLATIHRVKGAEWDRVIVFGADRGSMPHDLATDREEERRVMYVALTRGRHRVTVMADADRPSPFLVEMTEDSQPPRPPGDAEPEPESPGSGESDDALFGDLKEWRLNRSRKLELPAFMLFSDRTLREISTHKPRTSDDLLAVNGVGPVKLELYGEEVLEIVRRACP